MNIAIIDDSELDQKNLYNFISLYCKQHKLTAQIQVFKKGTEFLKTFQPKAFQIIFLDIYMEDLDGIQTAEKIREQDKESLIVFSTTSEHHAVKSYRVRAFDYLVKPYDYPQFEEVMALCDHAVMKYAHYIEVKEGRGLSKVWLRNILYADYSNHYVQIHTKERIIKTYIPFNEFWDMIKAYPQFLYCYRNCLINMDEVNSMDDKDFTLYNGEKIPIARSNRTEIKHRYADYIFNKLDGGV